MADNVSMLSYTHMHKLLRKIKVAIYIHQANCQLYMLFSV